MSRVVRSVAWVSAALGTVVLLAVLLALRGRATLGDVAVLVGLLGAFVVLCLVVGALAHRSSRKPDAHTRVAAKRRVWPVVMGMLPAGAFVVGAFCVPLIVDNSAELRAVERAEAAVATGVQGTGTVVGWEEWSGDFVATTPHFSCPVIAYEAGGQKGTFTEQFDCDVTYSASTRVSGVHTGDTVPVLVVADQHGVIDPDRDGVTDPVDLWQESRGPELALSLAQGGVWLLPLGWIGLLLCALWWQRRPGSDRS